MRVPKPFSLNLLPTLDTRVEWMAYCLVCECEQIFAGGWECSAGLVGCCLGCGHERVALWTRQTSR
jgi:hypothetical protein